jgi:hypothetical protein
MEELDAYGHLMWTVNSADNVEDDWMACFDASYCPESKRIFYHVVVNSDSAGFLETVEKGSISPYDEIGIEYLKQIPDVYFNVGAAQGLTMGLDGLEETSESWKKHLRELICESL